MSDWDDGRPASEQRPSLGRLVEKATEQVTRIARTEIELAKAQLVEKARNAGIGIALLVVAGVLGFFILVYLVFAGYLGLAHVFVDWLASLLTAAGLLIIVGVFAGVGVKALQRGIPKTDETVDSLKQDLAALKGGGVR